MTITVDIRPEVQAELARQPAARGRAIEAHAATLLEDAVYLPADIHTPAFDRDRARAAGEYPRVTQGRHAWGTDHKGVDR